MTETNTPDAQMREATVAWYRFDHPDDPAGATVAGYLASLRVQRRVDPHAIPTQDATVRGAMSRVDIAAVERWLDANWNNISEVIA